MLGGVRVVPLNVDKGPLVDDDSRRIAQLVAPGTPWRELVYGVQVCPRTASTALAPAIVPLARLDAR